ncbi:uncharacterized protein CBL_02884 [Carabus blaptoides fortunei]
MNLLPKSHQDFSQKEYWNTFFSKRGKKAFEWYGEYPELCGHLHKYIKPKDDILIIGCGNSKLSMDLYDVSYRNITNIDISQVVIKQMLDVNKYERPDMKYLHMDALNMTFADESFSVVLDKGTLDALMPNDSAETIQQIEKLFSEIGRVLKVGGRYVCVSLLQEHILKQLLSYFPASNWMFRIVRCHEAEQKTVENNETPMAVFIVICTKLLKLPLMVLETCMAGDKMQRFNSVDEILATVKNVQQAALVCAGLTKNNIADEDEVSFDLFEPGKDKARFTIYILDQQFERKNGQYSAFIVPQGRETEWLFSTKEGRKKLLKTANFNRLAIVTMHRGQDYKDLESVKQELNDTIRNLAPANLTETIPFLSLGGDVGKREIRYEGNSEFSGPFVIEDTTGHDGQIFRRLIFLQNQNVVQSEAKLKSIKVRGSKRKLKADPGYLACQHHVYMSVGVQHACAKQTGSKIVVIGLGGGGLCTFLNHILPELSITAVDIDAAMLRIANEYFGLPQNNKLQVLIEDGLKFLENAVEKGSTFDAILFDVDSKDPTLGMSCPPKEFLERNALENVQKCLSSNGIFILNLVLRDENLRDSILTSLKDKFKTISSCKLKEDLNEIFFCTNQAKDWTNDIKMAAEQLNSAVRKKKGDVIEISSIMECLKLYD